MGLQTDYFRTVKRLVNSRITCDTTDVSPLASVIHSIVASCRIKQATVKTRAKREHYCERDVKGQE